LSLIGARNLLYYLSKFTIGVNDATPMYVHNVLSDDPIIDLIALVQNLLVNVFVVVGEEASV